MAAGTEATKDIDRVILRGVMASGTTDEAFVQMSRAPMLRGMTPHQIKDRYAVLRELIAQRRGGGSDNGDPPDSIH